jgi:hypothetical protein
MASSRKTLTLCERDTRQLRGTNLIHPLARDVKDTIKWCLVSTSFKIYLDILSTCISRSRSFITTLFHSSVHFFPVLVKGLYQTESYSLHVMQLIRIQTTEEYF